MSPLASWDTTGVPSPLAISSPLMAGNWPLFVTSVVVLPDVIRSDRCWGTSRQRWRRVERSVPDRAPVGRATTAAGGHNGAAPARPAPERPSDCSASLPKVVGVVHDVTGARVGVGSTSGIFAAFPASSWHTACRCCRSPCRAAAGMRPYAKLVRDATSAAPSQSLRRRSTFSAGVGPTSDRGATDSRHVGCPTGSATARLRFWTMSPVLVFVCDPACPQRAVAHRVAMAFTPEGVQETDRRGDHLGRGVDRHHDVPGEARRRARPAPRDRPATCRWTAPAPSR